MLDIISTNFFLSAAFWLLLNLNCATTSLARSKNSNAISLHNAIFCRLVNSRVSSSSLVKIEIFQFLQLRSYNIWTINHVALVCNELRDQWAESNRLYISINLDELELIFKSKRFYLWLNFYTKLLFVNHFVVQKLHCRLNVIANKNLLVD